MLIIPSCIRIASRQSPLALWQSHYVAQKLEQQYAGLSTQIVPYTTVGDVILDRFLHSIEHPQGAGKALFTKELEQALAQNMADIAVHSLKDMPMELPVLNQQSFKIAAILKRGDPRDVFLSKHYASLDALPAKARVGTASLRRTCALARHYPHLDAHLLRGNINTRIQKMLDDEYDGIILAAAGVQRLNLMEHVRAYIPMDILPPAPAQGALAIEIYGDTHWQLCQLLQDTTTFLCCSAEREVSRLLGGSCNVPLSAYATLDNACMALHAGIFSRTGDYIESSATATVLNQNQAWALAQHVVADLWAKGARHYLL